MNNGTQRKTARPVRTGSLRSSHFTFAWQLQAALAPGVSCRFQGEDADKSDDQDADSRGKDHQHSLQGRLGGAQLAEGVDARLFAVEEGHIVIGELLVKDIIDRGGAHDDEGEGPEALEFQDFQPV